MSLAIDPRSRPLGIREAYDALGHYASTYGELPLRLLLHAAVPQSFRADLLNLLKVNFVPEAGGDLSVDADVLFSPLVEATAAGYFRLDSEVRRQSLNLLDAVYRSDRERRSVRVARFLIAWLDQLEQAGPAGMDPLLTEYSVIQRWVALALIDPPTVAAALAKSLSDALADDQTAVRARLGGIAAALSIPLPGHQPLLLSYAQGIDALRTGNADEARQLLEPLGDSEIRVGDITLPPAAELLNAYLPQEFERPPLGPGSGPNGAILIGGPAGWSSFIEAGKLWQSILPAFLPNQRWFAGKGQRIASISLADAAEYASAGSDFLIACIDVTLDDGTVQRYLLPLTIAWATKTFDPLAQLQPYTLGRVRLAARIGALHDAMASPQFAQAVVRGIRAGVDIPTRGGGRVVFRPTKAMSEMPSVDEPAAERLGREQSNTSVLIGEDMILKALRRLQPGIHPEIEIGRFLTDVSGFRNTPPLLGSVEMTDARGEPTAIAVLHGFVRTQGDGWSFALDYLDRVLRQLEMMPTSIEVNEEDLHAMFQGLSQTLGTRVGELHQAFALAVEDPAFRPEAVTESDVAAWKSLIRQQAAQARAALQRVFETSAVALFDAESLLNSWAEVDRTIDAALPTVPDINKTRLHGDLHLGQVLVVRDDFYILDFEGEPLRSVEERRAKQSPLRDVAGMVRSFSYAARTALQQRGNHGPEKLRQLQRAIEEWERQTISAFVESYRAATAGCPSVPADDATFQHLLRLFLLEKALYEMCYEAANRPDWIVIPVHGVLRLLPSAS